MNKWSELLGIPFPACKMTGQCCRCASPSTPAIKLLEKGANSEFARDFFSIFIPYKNIEEAEKINPEMVKRCLNSAKKPTNKVSVNNIAFFHCRYIADDNKCLIYEDRPQLCRVYPDSPFVIFAAGCAYEEWAKQCKEKHDQIKEEITKLTKYKEELQSLKYQIKAFNLLTLLQRINNKNYNLVLLLPSLSLISPGKSWIKVFR
ncbi:MAG: hypothetical protein V2B14_04195 [bacterium]